MAYLIQHLSEIISAILGAIVGSGITYTAQKFKDNSKSQPSQKNIKTKSGDVSGRDITKTYNK